jgi:hypothetical protein
MEADSRDESAAELLLVEAAKISTNQTTKSGREAFLSLSPEQRIALLKNISIVDASPDIVDVRDQLSIVLYHAAPRGKVVQLIDRLEGWWFAEVAKALHGDVTSIPLLQIDALIDEIREGLARDALPVDFADALVPQDDLEAYDQRVFVRQLGIIKIGSQRTSIAIRDYYRAFEQRSKWLREDLIFDDELARYERLLVETWMPRFEEMRELLCDCNVPDEKIQAGRDIYRWIEQEAKMPLRSVTAPFLCHGSYHMLSDVRKVGWHLDYEALLMDESSRVVETE